MRKISIEEAKAGDVVAEPVQEQNGRVLLPVGAKLSQAVLSRLEASLRRRDNSSTRSQSTRVKMRLF